METMVRDESPGPVAGGRPPPPPGSGFWAGAWRTFGALLAIAGLLWGTYNVITLLAHEERTERTTYDAADVTSLRVENSSGTVRILTADVAEISVDARISDGLRRTGERQTLTGGVLELRASCPIIGSNFCDVDYDVVVPDDVPISVSADNGRVEITGSTADVDVNADNGTVELIGLSGMIDAETDNGRLLGRDLRSERFRGDTDNGRVELDFAEAPTDVVVTSDNGSIEVVVPDDDAAYRVVTESDNGSETIEVPTNPNAERAITISADNGSVTARTAP